MSLPNPAAVLFVHDVPRVTEFYRQVASMLVVHQENSHSILEVQGFQLVVHGMSGEPSPSQGNEQVPVRDDSYWKICLPVESIAGARTKANGLGGLIKSTDYEWEARGFRACDGNDPEGNVIQVRESSSEQ